MCLGIPGRVTEIWGDGDLVNGRVDFGGVSREVCLSYVPEVTVGQYVIVHVGFAISVVDEDEARRTLEILAAMGDLVTVELADDTAPPGRAGPATAGGIPALAGHEEDR
jgi:hydrogenase expression/formation protein HypC